MGSKGRGGGGGGGGGGGNFIGRVKRAGLVVQLARFFYIYIYICVSSLRPCRLIPYRF